MEKNLIAELVFVGVTFIFWAAFVVGFVWLNPVGTSRRIVRTSDLYDVERSGMATRRRVSELINTIDFSEMPLLRALGSGQRLEWPTVRGEWLSDVTLSTGEMWARYETPRYNYTQIFGEEEERREDRRIRLEKRLGFVNNEEFEDRVVSVAKGEQRRYHYGDIEL